MAYNRPDCDNPEWTVTETMAQYIFSMYRVSKVVPPKRTILKDISLSFFPGAKIGVLGLNGSGKSTLLRIMAGVDKEFEGEARALSGTKIGYLPQEPELDPNKTVKEIVEEAVADVKQAFARLDEVYAASDVLKVHPTRLNAFASPQTGPLAPFGEGRMLPVEAYTSDEVFAWEKANFFSGWTCLGRSSDIAEPGMQRADKVGDRIFVEGDEGSGAEGVVRG
mgnify:CR=1 FL=1